MVSEESGDESDPKWTVQREKRFKGKLRKVTRRNPRLRDAFEKKIRAVAENPLTIGKQSKNPPDTRHVHVMSHWVLWWRVDQNKVIFLNCGHWNEFFG